MYFCQGKDPENPLLGFYRMSCYVEIVLFEKMRLTVSEDEEVISELMNLNYSGSKKVKNNFRAFFSRPSLDINSIKFNLKVLNEKNPLVAYFGYYCKRK